MMEIVTSEGPTPNWPSCITPDCPYRRCLWTDTEWCYPCAEKELGPDEMYRLYNNAHQGEMNL
jgi:hypothetical protein